MVLVGIDHHVHGLPQAYIGKYGPGLADLYPVGHVIDARQSRQKTACMKCRL